MCGYDTGFYADDFDDNDGDDNHDEDDNFLPTIASPSRPPSLEFSSSITCIVYEYDTGFYADNFDGNDDDKNDGNLSP